VFCNEDGTLIFPDSVTKAFQRLSREAGLPVIRLHDLRHTASPVGLSARTTLKMARRSSRGAAPQLLKPRPYTTSVSKPISPSWERS
jgi:integrase